MSQDFLKPAKILITRCDIKYGLRVVEGQARQTILSLASSFFFSVSMI